MNAAHTSTCFEYMILPCGLSLATMRKQLSTMASAKTAMSIMHSAKSMHACTSTLDAKCNLGAEAGQTVLNSGNFCMGLLFRAQHCQAGVEVILLFWLQAGLLVLVPSKSDETQHMHEGMANKAL